MRLNKQNKTKRHTQKKNIEKMFQLENQINLIIPKELFH